LNKGPVLIVSNMYPPHVIGGAEIVAHRQAAQLALRGWDVAAFTGRFAEGSDRSGALELEEFEGLPVYRINHVSFEPDANFRWQKANQFLASIIESRRPKLVHFHNPIGLGAELIRVAKRMGIKVVVTLHDHWGFCFKNTLIRNDNSICSDFEDCENCRPSISLDNGVSLPIRLRRDYVAWCLEHADLLISPSRSLANNYRKFGFSEGRLSVVSNGIDLPSISGGLRSPEIKIKFLAASYLGEHKGIPTLLEALRILLKKPKLAGKWQIVIAGHGHLESSVKALAYDPGARKHVKFAGRLPRVELLEALGEAHVVILPSVWPENEPVIILEAIASGAAVIATDIGGNRDIFEAYSPGFLCLPRDADDLAQKMEALINEPASIVDTSRRNLANAAKLSEAHTIDRLEQLYDASPSTISEGSRVIICAGGQPDAETIKAINSLSRDPGARTLRLIWDNWADPDVWSRALGFWWWAKTGGLMELSQAAKRGVPICMRSGSETGNISKLLPIELYQTPEDIACWLTALPASRSNALSREIPVLRHFDQVRGRHGFNFPLED
jgi:glycosyltransferase involved in cell wall biosynthesis